MVGGRAEGSGVVATVSRTTEQQNACGRRRSIERRPQRPRSIARSMPRAPSPCRRRPWRRPPAAAGRPGPPARRAAASVVVWGEGEGGGGGGGCSAARRVVSFPCATSRRAVGEALKQAPSLDAQARALTRYSEHAASTRRRRTRVWLLLLLTSARSGACFCILGCDRGPDGTVVVRESWDAVFLAVGEEGGCGNTCVESGGAPRVTSPLSGEGERARREGTRRALSRRFVSVLAALQSARVWRRVTG
jgi:hypothetical protein